MADPVSPRRSRTASLTQSPIDANPHHGFRATTGDALSSTPGLKDLRRNSLNSLNGGSRPHSASRRRSSVASPGTGQPPIHEGEEPATGGSPLHAADADSDAHPHWWSVTKSGLRAFWTWFLTPMGFLTTLYMLNIVGWGGMLFLLLCNAAPAMCTPTCTARDSPRLIWLEIDSQILNALFCVTGFGLIPWRFRDLWFLLRWRIGGRADALARLCGTHVAWFRGVDDPKVPQTSSWKLDFVVWMYVMNTLFQAVLSGFMWGMNRVDRPGWSTGLFVALACIVGGAGGGMVWWEGKKVKQIEGREEEKAGTV